MIARLNIQAEPKRIKILKHRCEECGCKVFEEGLCEDCDPYTHAVRITQIDQNEEESFDF